MIIFIFKVYNVGFHYKKVKLTYNVRGETRIYLT